jgi:threonine aldolase
MDPAEVEDSIRKPSVHLPRTSLISIENTHNNLSGAVVSLDNINALREVADKHGLKLHIDGARIFNAEHASGVSARDYAAQADSLMFCLSKGLSAPVGSLLVGPRDFIDYARRLRKALGGGMRQVGVLAAPGIIALTEMRDRLKDDNERAQRLAGKIAGFPGVELDARSIQTNIVIFGFRHRDLSATDFLEKLKAERILALATRGGIRFVTHKDVNDADVERVVKAFQAVLGPPQN